VSRAPQSNGDFERRSIEIVATKIAELVAVEDDLAAAFPSAD